MKRDVCIKRDYGEMSREAANVMRSVIDRNPAAVTVLATGHSPKLAYRYLVKGLLEDQVDTRELTFVKLDEWIGLLENDKATCEYFIRKEILEPLSVRDDHYIRFNTEAEDAEEECKRIEDAYSRLAEVDMVILGIGMNGHLGLNEPGEHLSGSAHSVRLDAKTRTHEMLSHTDRLVEYGVTLGMENLFRGRQILLLADGKHKEAGLEYYLNDVITTQIPVSLLKLHPNCRCIINQESFGNLDILNSTVWAAGKACGFQGVCG